MKINTVIRLIYLKFRKFIKNYWLRKTIWIAIFIISVLLLRTAYIFIVEWRFFTNHYSSITGKVASDFCEIPMPNPMDDSVMQYAKKVNPAECEYMQPDLTYLDYGGVLHLNPATISSHGFHENELTCKYQTFKREENHDDRLSLDPEKILKKSVKLADDRQFVAVICQYEQKTIYENVHAYIPKRKNKIQRDQNKPQVFIFVIESMSRLNMIRHMPKTYSYLTDVMRAEVLKGLTKVADNSFPNMVPMLTGGKVEMIPPELPGENCDGPYDDWPFVWKNFSSSGYITALTEDNPEFTIFNYVGKGFVKQPTDYYPRPLWIRFFKAALLRDKLMKGLCLGNITSYDILFGWIKEFLLKFSNELYFLFSFYITVTHNDFNMAQSMDDPVLIFLKYLFENGYLKNTIVMIMGDHGNRFGSVVTTQIGRIEERMPAFLMTIPQFLDKQYPHLRKYLKRNSEYLTSWLDIHSMLMDIATSSYKESDPKHIWNSRGYSPWRMNIPKNRTCAEAGIPKNYCVCQNEISVSPENPVYLEAAKKLVDHVNVQLERIQEFCEMLSLKKILQTSVLLPSKSTAQRKGYEFKVRILISVTPSDALLEALLRKTAWMTDYEVVGDVSRLNKYGNQSACIIDRVLRKYCYCKKSVKYTQKLSQM